MDTLLNNCRERTRNAVLDLLWRQWCTLGVAGNAFAVSKDRLIDLDALVLATSSLGRSDPRLFDEALDWLGQYGFLVNLQRVKNLRKRSGLGDEQVLAAMADWLWKKSGQPRWKLFDKGKEAKAAIEPRSLFIEQEGIRARKPDPVFAKHGLERNLFEPRGMSRAPDPDHPANLMPVLRSLMGVSSRVEILLVLGGLTGALHATEIAEATGYSPRTLQIQLLEMLVSGHVQGPPQSLDENKPVRRGSNRAYSLGDDISEFLSPQTVFPEWTPWASLFRISEQVHESFPRDGKPTTNPLVISSKLREVLLSEFKTLLAQDLWCEFSIRLDAKGETLLSEFCEGFPRLLEKLAEGIEG